MPDDQAVAVRRPCWARSQHVMKCMGALTNSSAKTRCRLHGLSKKAAAFWSRVRRTRWNCWPSSTSSSATTDMSAGTWAREPNATLYVRRRTSPPAKTMPRPSHCSVSTTFVQRENTGTDGRDLQHASSRRPASLVANALVLPPHWQSAATHLWINAVPLPYGPSLGRASAPLIKHSKERLTPVRAPTVVGCGKQRSRAGTSPHGGKQRSRPGTSPHGGKQRPRAACRRTASERGHGACPPYVYTYVYM